MDIKGRKLSHYRIENCSICNVCNTYLQGDVFNHIKEAHCDCFYKCHLCRNYSGLSKSNLFQHQKDKHRVSCYYLACPICMLFCSLEETEIMTHLVKVHSRIENKFVCNYCSFKSQSDLLDAHFKETHSRYVCVIPNCQAVCQNSLQLFQHYMGHHFPKLTLFHNCSECDYMFPKENSLQQHKRDKHGILDDEYGEEEEDETFIEFHCPLCPFTTFDKKHYEQHSSKKHSDVFFNCTYPNCSYQTKLFWSITQHTIDKHLSNTFLRYDCYECDEISFSEVHSLIQHLRDKHSVVETCSRCNSYEDDLSDHIWSIPDHSFDVFSCTICNEEYEEKAYLVDHLSENHISITPLLKRLCFGC